MSMLLPGFADQLADRAERLAAEHTARTTSTTTPRDLSADPPSRTQRRWRMPHGRRLGVSVLVLGIAASGGAYASKGFWQPHVGGTGAHQGRATASALPPDQLRMLSVLRRPQTEADRGAGSRYALKFAGNDLIRTSDVRLLTTLSDGASVVLIPVAKYGSDHATPMLSDHDLLCMWVRDIAGGGAVKCGTTGELASGVFVVGLATPGKPLPGAPTPPAGAPAPPLLPSHVGETPGGAGSSWRATMRFTTVGLVPDGVAEVQFGGRAGSPRVRVVSNVYEVAFPLTPDIVWLDKHGNTIPRVAIHR